MGSGAPPVGPYPTERSSNGQAGGTALAADVRSGTLGSKLEWPAELSGSVYFAADDGQKGTELWSVVAVPEPSLALQLAAGLAVLLTVGHRRFQA